MGWIGRSHLGLTTKAAAAVALLPARAVVFSKFFNILQVGSGRKNMRANKGVQALAGLIQASTLRAFCVNPLPAAYSSSSMSQYSQSRQVSWR